MLVGLATERHKQYYVLGLSLHTVTAPHCRTKTTTVLRTVVRGNRNTLGLDTLLRSSSVKGADDWAVSWPSLAHHVHSKNLYYVEILS